MADVRMGRGLRRHARPPRAQRRRRAPRRDAAALPPPRRAPRRAGPAAGDLRHRHARRRRQHPDPHRADDRAHEVRRHHASGASASASSTSSPGGPGRPGFDPDGHVWVQAPDHVIENARALAKAGDDPKARRKATKAKAAGGLRALRRGGDAAPRRRHARSRSTSRFRVTADLVAGVLSRPDGPVALKHLLRTNHDPEPRRRQHQRRAIAVYRSLEAAGVAERRARRRRPLPRRARRVARRGRGRARRRCGSRRR